MKPLYQELFSDGFLWRWAQMTVTAQPDREPTEGAVRWRQLAQKHHLCMSLGWAENFYFFINGWGTFIIWWRDQSSLTSMHPYVGIQLRNLVESLRANTADMVPYAPVLLHVLAERGVATEWLAAFCTFEWFLARVQAEVNLRREG